MPSPSHQASLAPILDVVIIKVFLLVCNPQPFRKSPTSVKGCHAFLSHVQTVLNFLDFSIFIGETAHLILLCISSLADYLACSSFEAICSNVIRKFGIEAPIIHLFLVAEHLFQIWYPCPSNWFSRLLLLTAFFFWSLQSCCCSLCYCSQIYENVCL